MFASEDLILCLTNSVRAAIPIFMNHQNPFSSNMEMDIEENGKS